MASVFLLGGTDLTLRVANALLASGTKITGICYVGEQFQISYGSVRNVRVADVPGWAASRSIPAIQFSSMSDLEQKARFHVAEVALAIGWYHMIPAKVRSIFPHGCLGLHASLLPRLRGAAPLNWAILSGAKKTGISLFQMEDGVDTGPLFAQQTVPIGDRTDVGDLVEASAVAACELIAKSLPLIVGGSLKARPQSGVPTYGLQRIPADGLINWRDSAEALDRLIRAVSRPYAGAFTGLEQKKLVIWKARPLAGPVVVHGVPGQFFVHPGDSTEGGGSMCVMTGCGMLNILEATLADGSDALPVLRKVSQRRFDVVPEIG